MKYYIVLLILVSIFAGCATKKDNVITDEILEVFKQLPDNTQVNKNTKEGIIALKSNDLEKAHDAFESGLRLDPTNGHLHFLNSLTYHIEALAGNSKMLELAEAGYHTTLRFDESNYWASYFLGHIYFDCGRYVDAQNQFSYGLLYSPDNPYFLRALAVSSYYAKDLSTNRWAAKKAYQAQPDSASNLRTLMFSEAASGNSLNAKHQLQKYKKLVKHDKNSYMDKLTTTSLTKRINDWEYFYISSNSDDSNVFSSPDNSNNALLNLDGINDSDYDEDDDRSSDIPSSDSIGTKYIQKDGFDNLIYIMLLSTKGSAQNLVDKLAYPNLEIIEEQEGEFSVRRKVKEDEDASKILAKIKKKFKDAWMRPILPIAVPMEMPVKVQVATSNASIVEDVNATTAKIVSTKPIKPKVKLPKMVLVDVVILRTEELRSESKGVNLLDGLTATLAGTLLAYDNLSGFAAGSGSLNTHSISTSPTLTLVGLEYNLNIFNEGVNKVEILARPSLLAVEKQPSKFYSGSVLHVQLSSTYSDGSMVDVPIGIHLNITPKFHNNDTLEIVVHAERSYLETLSEKVGFKAFSQTAKTSVDATAVLKYGETLILSGLTVTEEGLTKSGVPLLQEIPGVQYLFSNEQKAELKKSILILLTPRKARYYNDEETPAEAKRILEMEEKTKSVHIDSLRSRERINDNIDATLAHFSNNRLYRQFRKGDLELDKWYDQDTMSGAFDRLLGFLYY